VRPHSSERDLAERAAVDRADVAERAAGGEPQPQAALVVGGDASAPGPRHLVAAHEVPADRKLAGA
jgi:hypothetical protein